MTAPESTPEEREAEALARKMLAEGSIYTFAAYRDAGRLAELVLLMTTGRESV